MSRKPRRAGCSRKLSRRILLAEGRALITLQHTGDLPLDVLGSVNAGSAHSMPIERLMQVATGRWRRHRGSDR